MIHLVVISSNAPELLRQALILRASLDTNMSVADNVEKVCLSPTYSPVESAPPGFSRLVFDIGKRRTDRFFAKFALAAFIKQAPGDDVVLYLDTDHVCRRAICFPNVRQRQAFLSSDVKPIENVIRPRLLHALRNRFPFLRDVPALRHYNSSIVYGQIRTLRSVCDDWRDLYEQMYNSVPHSILEELSLSFSLMKKAIPIQPLPSSFQSTFSNRDPSCCFFHYGGPSANARLIKTMISRGDRNTAQILATIDEAISCTDPIRSGGYQ